MVTKYFADRAFGFIKLDGRRTDVFFHKTAMVSGGEPKVDMVVEFVEEMDPRSSERAVSLTPAPSVARPVGFAAFALDQYCRVPVPL